MTIKKLLVVVSTILILTSCKAAMDETPEVVMQGTQEAIVNEVNNVVGKTEEGISKGKLSFEFESEDGNGKLDTEFEVKFDKNKKESETNIKLNVEGKESREGGADIKADAEVNLIAKEKMVYVNLKSLNLDSSDPSVAMAKGMIEGYLNKWISADITKYAPKELTQIDTKDVLVMQKDIIKALKENPVFKVEKQNEDSDYYNYDVKLDAENMVNLAEKITLIVNKDQAPSEEEKKKAIEEINKIKFSGTLKVNPSDKKYFMFDGKIEADEDLYQKELNINIENSKKKFVFKVGSEGNMFDINLNKNGNKFDGTISFKEGDVDPMVINIDGESDDDSLKLNVATEVKDQGKLKIGFEIKTDDKSVNIEAPSEAKSIEEIMGAIMGGMMAPPTEDLNSATENDMMMGDDMMMDDMMMDDSVKSGE